LHQSSDAAPIHHPLCTKLQYQFTILYALNYCINPVMQHQFTILYALSYHINQWYSTNSHISPSFLHSAVLSPCLVIAHVIVDFMTGLSKTTVIDWRK
jgi:hypothetical protein